MKAITLALGLTTWAAIATANPVSDAKAAIKIARAALIPVYGAKTIQEEEPLTAKRHGGSWYVTGTLYTPLGGTAFVEVSAKDGAILRMTHGK